MVCTVYSAPAVPTVADGSGLHYAPHMAFFFSKYTQGGAYHWHQLYTRSIFLFNAHQSACYEMALRALGDINGKRIADIGGGDGAFTSLLARRGAHVTAVDNEPSGIAMARSMFSQAGLSAEFILGDAQQIPLPDNAFDAVVSSEVIEHLDHPERHMAEMRRILKPGGTLVVTTPYRLGELLPPFHVHEFYPSELRKLAVDAQFADVSIVESHRVLWYAFYQYRFRSLRKRPIGKYLINIMTLWFRCNPFLADDSQREKRDYFSQITLRAVKQFTA